MANLQSILLRVNLLVFSAFVAVGCHGPSVSTDPERYLDQFLNGQIKLGRNNPIALPSPWDQRRMRNQWQQRQWSALARDVIENGYIMDINYFYLGEAASGLGRYDAARIYYINALNLSSGDRRVAACATFSADMCGGFILPQIIYQRLGLPNR